MGEGGLDGGVMGRGRVRWRSDGGEGGVMVRERVRRRSYGEREE